MPALSGACLIGIELSFNKDPGPVCKFAAEDLGGVGKKSFIPPAFGRSPPFDNDKRQQNKVRIEKKQQDITYLIEVIEEEEIEVSDCSLCKATN